MAMDQQLRDWKFEVDRLFAADAPDWHEVVRVVTSIAGASENPTLRLAAMQSHAEPAQCDVQMGGWRGQARRAAAAGDRAGGFEHADHAAIRQARRATKPLTPDERYRQLLGLPFGRHLPATEIHRAFKRAAKTAHPDGGGSQHAFLELAAARDALMKLH